MMVVLGSWALWPFEPAAATPSTLGFSAKIKRYKLILSDDSRFVDAKGQII